MVMHNFLLRQLLTEFLHTSSHLLRIGSRVESSHNLGTTLSDSPVPVSPPCTCWALLCSLHLYPLTDHRTKCKDNSMFYSIGKGIWYVSSLAGWSVSEDEQRA